MLLEVLSNAITDLEQNKFNYDDLLSKILKVREYYSPKKYISDDIWANIFQLEVEVRTF